MRRPSKKFIALQPAVTCVSVFCFVFVLVSSRSGSDQGGASISTFLNPNIPTRSARLVCLCVSVCWCARFVVDRTKQIYCFRFVLNGMGVFVWLESGHEGRVDAPLISSTTRSNATRCYIKNQ